MTTTHIDDVSAKPRTYGNWQQPSSPGLPRLGLIGTVALLGGLVLAVIIQATAGLLPALVVVVLVLLGVAPLAWRTRGGRNGWQLLWCRIAWKTGLARGQHLYLAGLVGTEAFGSHQLPGLLAPAKLHEIADDDAMPIGLIHIPASRHFTVLIRVDPDGSSLVDPETVDAWVGHYGTFLADLGHEPGLVAASCTVQTSPDPGDRLRAEVDRLLTPGAPSLATAVLREAAAAYPRGAAQTSAWVALTYTATRQHVEEREGLWSQPEGGPASKVRSTAEMATLISSRLPGLLESLAATGCGAGQLMSAREITDLVRSAFDPHSADDLDALRVSGEPPAISWEQAGPAVAAETWNAYRHDQAASVTWSMSVAPRGAVQSRVLHSLIAAHQSVARKRVTLLYRPHDAASSAAIADADVRTAAGRDGGKAHDSAASKAAVQTAQEEAQGAGMTRFALMVTATVLDPADLGQARETVSQLGRAGRVQLRCCAGSQAASFAACLGIGVVPSAHISVPGAGKGLF